MICIKCRSGVEKSFTTDVTELENGIVIVRHVPSYKCKECNEVIYTGDVVAKLEKILESAKKLMQEISVVEYSMVA
ncbi:MAG: YgiT-type zinc finger protein [Clostridiales bacterium]|nr:YgiT-type zinc finger protein [Clostridiales bacterium]